MLRPFTVLWFLVAVALSGCLADDSAPTPEPAMGGPDPTPTAVVDADEGPSDLPPVESQEVAVDASGTTSQGAWFCTEPDGTGGCQGQEVAGEEYTVHLGFEGMLVEATLQIAWDAMDPTLETMVIVHGIHTENGTERFEPFESTSPATVRIQDAAAGPDGMLYLALWPAAEAQSPAGGLFVDVQRQDFHVTGGLFLISEPGPA